MSQRRYSDAEQILIDAWGDPVEQDRDFSDNPSAQHVYGVDIAPNIEHFVYPLKFRDDEAYVKKRLPLRLFAELYPQIGQNQFDQAIARAKDADLDAEGVDTLISGNDPVEDETRPEHVKILRDTKARIE
jgi:hypothetical protein